MTGSSLPLKLWQLRLMLAFYKRTTKSGDIAEDGTNQKEENFLKSKTRLISEETLLAVSAEINYKLLQWLKGMYNICLYFLRKFIDKSK